MINLVHWRQDSEFLGFVSLITGADRDAFALADAIRCNAEEWLTGDMGL